ncbi:DUF4432 family protein [Pseudooceanicola sp. 216_PA32_1]|uniref:DUF4432 family protein n=1 Tax=Pseudooceanicola pacificus TaxID=2676438 RepID=A0A844WF57_9RHOB|nr:DUF4432 family protein [Pseudooceanicola pacificus]MWB77989.1 DUF4432 family protein [Pseudooceanicola pacificus]
MSEARDPAVRRPAGDLPGRHTEVLDLSNRTGLRVELVPERCLDLGQVTLHGVPFGWIGTNGIGPAGAGEMETALGGLLCTCGFDHIRQPWSGPDGRAYPLHGNMALRPAKSVTLETGTGLDGAPALIGTAEVLDRSDERAVYRLERRIEMPLHANRLRLRDRVTLTSEGRAAAIFALYHINLGSTFVGPGLTVTQGERRRDDIGALPGATFVEPLPGESATISLCRAAAGQTARLTLTQSRDQLPFIQFHRNPVLRPDLFCIEPVSHDRLPRETLLAGLMPWSGQIQRDFSLDIEFSVTPDDAE